MRAHVTWLSDDEKRLIYEEALALLESVGMKFGPSRALDLLAEAGAAVDRERYVARLPGELVERALASCPTRVVLAGAQPDDDVVLDGSIHFCPSGSAAHTLDYHSGEHRASILEDLRQSTIVADAMPDVDVMWGTCTANDVPIEQRLFVDLATILRETTKHVQAGVEADWHVAPMTSVCETLAGDAARFRERPRLSFVCCTTSPLEVDATLLDPTVEIAALGAPTLVYPMPIAGATAPVTIAGTVTMNIAEFLAVATVIELSHPGAPLIMGCGASILDMKAATFSFGGLEGALMSAACAEVAHMLGIPTLCPGVATDAKYAGIQAGYEKALKGLVVASAGADLITGGIGLLNGANTFSLPQIVIDAEIAAMIRRLVSDTEISSETVMSDMIARVGIGGHYLKEKETKLRIRAGEHFFPTIATRLSYEMWKSQGISEVGTAAARCDEILAAAAHRPPCLTPDQERELAYVGRVTPGG